MTSWTKLDPANPPVEGLFVGLWFTDESKKHNYIELCELERGLWYRGLDYMAGKFVANSAPDYYICVPGEVE